MRKLLFAMLLMLLIGAPAGAMSIVDDENANDEIGTAGIQIPREADPSAYAGSFSLTRNDADFVGLGPLVAGDVITAVTTPLEDGFFGVPDTILGVFNAAGVRLAFNDDAGDLGFGSAIRFLVPSAGDYFLAVSGFGDNLFEGLHNEDGRYVFTVSLAPIPIPNMPPDCSAAIAEPEELWPPDRKMADVSVVGVTDLDGDPVTLTITSIFQDEPVDSLPGTELCGDGAGLGTEMASVRAEFSGTGDGRVYSIGFTAQDDLGGECSGTVTVCVPRGQHGSDACVDQGPLFDSTDCGG
jgi:hypothetical protein